MHDTKFKVGDWVYFNVGCELYRGTIQQVDILPKESEEETQQYVYTIASFSGVQHYSTKTTIIEKSIEDLLKNFPQHEKNFGYTKLKLCRKVNDEKKELRFLKEKLERLESGGNADAG